MNETERLIETNCVTFVKLTFSFVDSIYQNKIGKHNFESSKIKTKYKFNVINLDLKLPKSSGLYNSSTE